MPDLRVRPEDVMFTVVYCTPDHHASGQPELTHRSIVTMYIEQEVYQAYILDATIFDAERSSCEYIGVVRWYIYLMA